MASVVNIELRLDESGALTGVRNLGAGLKSTTAAVNELDVAGKAAVASIEQLGGSGQRAGAQIATGMRAAGPAIDQVRNKTAMVRYEFQEMGIRVPRYLASVAAGFAPVMGALTAMSGVMIGIGVISMFGMAIKQAKDFYETHLSLTHAMDEYSQKAGEAAQKKLFDTASIETTASLLANINRQLDEIEERRKAIANEPLETDPDVAMAKLVQQQGNSSLEDSRLEAALSEQRDALRDRSAEQIAGRDRERLAADNEYRVAVAGKASKANVEFTNAEMEAQRKLNQTRAEETALFNREKAAYDVQQARIANKEDIPVEKRLPKPVKHDLAGEQQYQDDLYAARQKKSAELVEQSRSEAREMMQARHAAINADLRGDELLKAHEVQTIEAINLRFTQGEISKRQQQQLTAYEKQKFDAEERRRLEDQQNETTKLQMQSRVAGLTGAAKIRGEGEGKESDLLSDVQTGKTDPSQYWKRYALIEKETNALVAKDQQEFFDHIDELSAESADHQVSGFARIHMEAEKEFTALEKSFREHTAGLDATSPEYQQYATALGRGRAAISSSETSQAAKLTQTNADETLKLKEEARRKSLRGEAEKTQAIYDEYQDRIRKYKEQLRVQEISQDDFNRRVIAAEQEKNNALEEQAKATRDKLAGELSGFFRSPSKWLEGLGEKAMSQAAAGFMMQIPGVERLANDKGGIMGSIMDGGWTRGMRPRSRAASLNAPLASVLPGAPATMNLPDAWNRHGEAFSALTGGPSSLASSSLAKATSPATMSIPSATISIGSANIMVGGSGMESGAPGTGVGVVGGFASGASATPSAFDAAAGRISGPAAAVSSGMQSSGVGAVVHGISSTAAYAERVPGILQSSGIRLPNLSTTNSTSAAFADESYSSSDSTKLPNSAPGDSDLPGSYSPNYGGAVQGGMGMFGAVMGNGGASGAIGGAMSGAQLGGSFGGPIGAVVGGIAGGILGAIGFGGRLQAEAYWNKSGKPKMDQIAAAFNNGQEDYMSAYNDLEGLEIEADDTTKKLGPSAHNYFNDTIKHAITDEEKQMTREAKAGRQQVGFSAAQYHTGGIVDNFGHFSTSPEEGFIHARIGEFMVQPEAARRNRSALEALNAGASLDRVAAGYGTTMQTSRAQRSVSAARDVNMHFYSHDAKGARDLFFDNKHHLRAALNETYGEYSGGSDFEY